jgi:hypothetical protein
MNSASVVAGYGMVRLFGYSGYAGIQFMRSGLASQEKPLLMSGRDMYSAFVLWYKDADNSSNKQVKIFEVGKLKRERFLFLMHIGNFPPVIV